MEVELDDELDEDEDELEDDDELDDDELEDDDDDDPVDAVGLVVADATVAVGLVVAAAPSGVTVEGGTVLEIGSVDGGAVGRATVAASAFGSGSHRAGAASGMRPGNTTSCTSHAAPAAPASTPQEASTVATRRVERRPHHDGPPVDTISRSDSESRAGVGWVRIRRWRPGKGSSGSWCSISSPR